MKMKEEKPEQFKKDNGMGVSIKDFIRNGSKTADLVNEAVKLSRVLPNGGTVEDVLVDIYKQDGEEVWTVKGIQSI